MPLTDSEKMELKALEGAAPKPGYMERMAVAGVRGMSGGPLGIVSHLGAEGMKIGGEMGEHAAYEAGGKVTDMTGSPAAGFATNVGIQAIPAFFGGALGTKAAPLMEKLSKELMQSALKPSKAEMLSGKGGRAVDTMLKEGANVTEGGVAKLRQNIDGINTQIADLVKNSTGIVKKDEVTQELLRVYDKALSKATPNADLAKLHEVASEFLNHPALRGSNEMTVQLAQKIKQGIYQTLGDKAYGLGLKPAAERDAQKALATGIRKQIEVSHPEVKNLNARDRELLNAEMIAKSRVLMDSNKNPMGLGWLISHPLEAAAWIMDRSPLAKSLLARAGYSGKERIPQAMGATAGAAVGAVTGREPTAADMAGVR